MKYPKFVSLQIQFPNLLSSFTTSQYPTKGKTDWLCFQTVEEQSQTPQKQQRAQYFNAKLLITQILTSERNTSNTVFY